MISLTQPWGMKQLYYERMDKPELNALGCERVEDLNELLARSDIVSINVPLTDKTKGMFDKALIAKMKKVRSVDLSRACLPFVCLIPATNKHFLRNCNYTILSAICTHRY